MGSERGLPRLLLLSPIQPARSGNGLAMRCDLFRRAGALDFEVQTALVPVAGGELEAGSIAIRPDGAAARAGLRALLADAAWRERLASAGRLPRAARAASPGLAAELAQALGGRSFQALHVERAYMAPLGVALAERLGVAVRTLDLDDDDAAAFASVHGDIAEAHAYERLIGVFAGLYDGVCAASPLEAHALAERHRLRVEHVPNAVEIPVVARRRAARELRLLFLANLTYPPNVEAARLLVEELLPRLRALLGGRPLQLTLAGREHGELERLASPTVHVRGFVDDLGPLYAEADVVVVPLRSGGGTRIKLLEAFAHGVPVVATPIAAEGLAVIDGRHLLMGADFEQLAAAVVALASDGALAASVAEQAGRLVRERYSHEAVIPRVRAFLSGARAGERASQPVPSS